MIQRFVPSEKIRQESCDKPISSKTHSIFNKIPNHFLNATPPQCSLSLSLVGVCSKSGQRASSFVSRNELMNSRKRLTFNDRASVDKQACMQPPISSSLPQNLEGETLARLRQTIKIPFSPPTKHAEERWKNVLPFIFREI